MKADERRSRSGHLRVSVFICGLLFCSVLRADADSPFGINGCAWSHLGMNSEKFDREAGLKRLKALKEAGAKWDRCDFWWGRIEPEEGKFVWDDVDWVVKQYQDAGIELMPILCYGSAWQKSDAPVTDDERALYARYVLETVNRYKHAIHAWEIWNEPNITPFWSPKPDVKDYAKLLKLAYEAAKKADPKCTVVGAVTAGCDLPFIEALLNEGGGEWMDVISIHPYQGDLGSLSPDAGGLARQIAQVQQLLAKKGLRKPIWITEIGHRTTGTAGHTSVSEQQQAAYLIRTFVIAQAAGVEKIFWFNLQDWEEFWGIISRDFSRKPSFEAYQTMVQHLQGRIPAGTIELGENVAAYVFAAPHQKIEREKLVVVMWSLDDSEATVWLGEREQRIGMMPIFLTRPDDSILRKRKPLPPPP